MAKDLRKHPLGAIRRSRRNQKIAELRAKGVSVRSIAYDFGLTETMVNTILRTLRHGTEET